MRVRYTEKVSFKNKDILKHKEAKGVYQQQMHTVRKGKGSSPGRRKIQ